MTLNMSVLTSHCIYQSADYRLTDVQTKRTTDFQTQKIFIVNTFEWSATVCFTGVGCTSQITVHEWLSEQLGLVQSSDPFDRLIDELVKAESWLSHVPPPHNKFSLSVGAFIGRNPVFVLISNFERPSGQTLSRATRTLSVFKVRISKPKVFVPGQPHAVTIDEKTKLRDLAVQNPGPDLMHSLLAEINRRASTRNNNISPSCFTTHLQLTGEGDTQAHDVSSVHLPSPVAMPKKMRQMVKQFADNHYGPGLWQMKSLAFARWSNSEEFHKTQLSEKPRDPNVHSNYGLFLEQECDIEGAEREYRKAIELDPNHVNGLGNLANLIAKKGDLDEAAKLYREALQTNPGNENVTWNFVHFLVREFRDLKAARDLLEKGIAANPESGRLLMLRAEFSLSDGFSSEALRDFREARKNGADQNRVETGYAYALHLSGAPIDKCIPAYHVAISLNQDDGGLRLNLAQLLFLKGDAKEASRKLIEATRLGLDDSAQLEAQFYRLCHTDSDPVEIFPTIKVLLSKEARLRWNMKPNVETIRSRDPQKAALLEKVIKVMTGEADQLLLDQIITIWPNAASK